MTLLDDIAAARAALAEAELALRNRPGDPALRRRRGRAAGALTNARHDLLAPAADPLALTDARYPLLMLPVRLEARYAWQTPSGPGFVRPATGAATPLLLVRVYPDDVHLDAHDPPLTEQEVRWLRLFEKRTAAGRDRVHFVRAWEELVDRVGRTRAAWIVRQRGGAPRPLTVPDRLGRPVRAALLPDRFVARAQLTEQAGGGWVQQLGEPVREPLDVSPDPTAAGHGADGLRWMVDFDEAVKAGLGLVLTLPATAGGPPAVRRLVVVGAHASRDPKASAEALAALLDAHHYTGGLSFMRPGAATNAVPGERTDRTTEPDIEDVFDVEGDLVPLAPPSTLVDQPPADGLEAAELLGLDPAVFGHVAGADGRWRQAGRDLRQLIASAWTGPLQHLLDPLVPRAEVQAAADFYVAAVDALGPLPVLRIGDQPYGVLPVSPLAAGEFDLSEQESRLLGALGSLRGTLWEPAADAVPRIGGDPAAPAAPADPTATLLALLRSDGVVRSAAVRPVLGPLTAAAVLGTFDPRRLKLINVLRTRFAELLGALAAVPGDPPLTDLVLTEAVPLAVPFVSDDPGTDLDALAMYPPAAFTLLELGYQVDAPPSLLAALARLALLAAADRSCRELLLATGVVDEAMVAAWERELDTGTAPLYAITDRLNAMLPGDPFTPLHALLTSTAPPAGAEPFLSVRQAIRSLAMPPSGGPGRPNRHPAALLETVLRAELAAVTSRLDAWYTALATERLRRLRTQPGRERGLVLGGYGVLLDLVPNAPASTVDPAELPPGHRGQVLRPADNAGYVHAPSVGHAVAAGVLRSAHLAQWRLADPAGPGRDAFAVDLSSRRVRTALGLLDGVREGQPLAALLGYRMERIMRGAAPAGIAVLRRAAPLVAGRLTAGGPVEHVAADAVVDALGMLALTGAGTATAVGTALAPYRGGVTDADWPRVVDAAVLAVADAADALDAVADLLVAEGVYQLVQGNPVRSAGSVDAIAAAGTPPPQQLAVAESVRGGIAVVHRAAVLLPAGPVPADEPDGWGRTARVLLEPALERWARAVLPAPADVPLAAGTLAQAQRAAYDAGAGPLRLSALDVVLAEPAAVAARLGALAGEVVEAVPAELAEAAAALRELLSTARPLRPEDLVRDAAAGTDPSGATARLATYVGTARAAHAALAAALAGPDRDALVAALLAADAVGATQPVPARPLATPDADPAVDLVELAPAAVTARDELAGRLAAHDAATSLTDRATAMAALVLPALTLSATAVPDGATPPAVHRHLARGAAVRPALARLDRVLSTVEALTGALPELAASQWPLAAGERWAALGGGPVRGGRTTLTAYTPFPGEAPAAGLFLDEWTEVVPDATATTSLAFHYDAPGSAAPNVALLGVPRPNLEQWSTDTAVDLVLEALELARLRAVDPDLLAGAAGALLPPLYSRENPEPGVHAGLAATVLTDPS